MIPTSIIQQSSWDRLLETVWVPDVWKTVLRIIFLFTVFCFQIWKILIKTCTWTNATAGLNEQYEEIYFYWNLCQGSVILAHQFSGTFTIMRVDRLLLMINDRCCLIIIYAAVCNCLLQSKNVSQNNQLEYNG